MTSLSYIGAAHLLRRAGFGGSREEIESLAARGREGAVDYLVDYEAVNNDDLGAALKKAFKLKKSGGFLFRDIRRWWITRIILTNRPLEEKMTLFWHNHFATSGTKVPLHYMYFQNLLLRDNAMGKFDDLLLRVARDSAMLIWLDGYLSVRNNENENFARELQELFTMGVRDAVTDEPNYTEQDVKEMARIFTGWRVPFPNGSVKINKPGKYEAFFDERFFDAGAKTIYGQTAFYASEDIIPIIAARRATPRFLVKRLFEAFVYSLTSSEEDKQTIEKFADVYLQNDHRIRPLMRAILVSDEFFSDRAMFANIKNPVEYIVSAMRALEAGYDQARDGALSDISLYIRLAAMGMDLLFPPDVAGWSLNLGWINSSTMLERYNLANDFATNKKSDFTSGPFITTDDLRRHVRPAAEETVRNFLFILGPLTVDDETVERLTRYLETDERGNPRPFDASAATVDLKVRGLLHQILSLAEYQLN